MKSKSIFLMAVSLGFGLVAAIGITQVMGRSNEPAPTREEPKLPILIATQDIDINAELSNEMFVEEEWPARLVPEGVATGYADLEGMVTTARIGKKGTILLSNLLEKSKLREKKIPAGMKVIGIKLGADDHLNGLLEAGDLVDIMAVFRGNNRNSGSGSMARTFLRKVRIWSIGSKTKKDIEQSASAKGSTVVGLLVTEKQAEKIMLADRIAELKLAMRGFEDANAATQSTGTSADDLQEEDLSDADAVLAQLMNQNNQVPPAMNQPVTAITNEPEVKPDTFVMVVHTGTGPTQYTFEKDASVAKRSEGFAGEDPLPEESLLEEPSPESALDFEDDEADVGSESLIEDLDSEPSS